MTLIYKIIEMYQSNIVVMIEFNLIIAMIVYMIYTLIEDRNNHIARQLSKKLKRSKKKKKISLEIDLENGILAPLAKKVELKMKDRLEKADVNFSPKEFSFFFIVGMLGGAVLGFLFFPHLFLKIAYLFTGNFTAKIISRILSTLFFAAAGTSIPFIILSIKTKKRKKQLGEQLIDFIMSLADGLKSTRTTQEAIRVVAKELPDPISSELNKVVDELEYTIPFEEAMENFKKRVDLQEYTLVITAMQIQAKTGSHLEKMLRNMARVSEERRETRGEVLKIVRSTKSTAYILLVSPFVLAGGMFLLMPEMMIPTYTGPFGIIILVAFAIIYSISVFLIKSINKYVEKSL